MTQKTSVYWKASQNCVNPLGIRAGSWERGVILVHSELAGKSSESFLRLAGQFTPSRSPPQAQNKMLRSSDSLFARNQERLWKPCLHVSSNPFSHCRQGSLPPPVAAIDFLGIPLTSYQLPHSFTQGLFAVLGIEPRVSGILSKDSVPELYPQLCVYVQMHGTRSQRMGLSSVTLFPHRVSHCFA